MSTTNLDGHLEDPQRFHGAVLERLQVLIDLLVVWARARGPLPDDAAVLAKNRTAPGQQDWAGDALTPSPPPLPNDPLASD
eukprot:7520100-Pyramimonas_sp.AAC.1